MAAGNAKKTVYLGMSLHDGTVRIFDSLVQQINLPEGCIGISFIFRSKRAAQKWHGKKVELLKLEILPKVKV